MTLTVRKFSRDHTASSPSVITEGLEAVTPFRYRKAVANSLLISLLLAALRFMTAYVTPGHGKETFLRTAENMSEPLEYSVMFSS